jgi:hypothetical protein
MKKIYYIPLFLSLSACTLPSNSEVIMRAGAEHRTPKSEYMPAPEKPFKDPISEKPTILPTLAPQVGIRVPLED